MEQYIFILGRNAELSIAEIKAVFQARNWDCKVVANSSEILIIESNKTDVEFLHNTLGGTIKIGRVEKVSSIETLEDDITIDFLTSQLLAKTTGKIQFGISVYDGGNKNGTENISGQITTIARGIKALLDSQNFSVRFAFNRDRFLSSVTVDKNKLIKKGAEILFVVTQDRIYIGKTLSVQEFEAFSRRDYGRPARDMKSGIMPPKLARMMINLAGIEERDALLDPFCGSGTIIQEAILLGYKHILGRDISQKAISDTQKNIEWLKTEQAFDKNLRIDLSVGDVTKLSSDFAPGSISAIVAEPYLGPTLHNQIYPDKLKSITSELSSLYIRAFSQFQKVLKSGGVVVFILPVFMQRNGPFYLQILPDIEKLGFTISPLAENKRGSVLYGNKHDFVLREIIRFTLS